MVRDFTAILYGLIVGSVVLVAASHITAERRYELLARSTPRARVCRTADRQRRSAFLRKPDDRLLVSGLVGLEALDTTLRSSFCALSKRAVSLHAGIHLPLVAKDP